jgi:hypothetical protein
MKATVTTTQIAAYSKIKRCHERAYSAARRLVQPNFSEIKFSISNFLAELAPDKYGASGLPRRAPSLKLRRHSTYPDIRRNVERPTNTVSGPMTTNGHKLLSFARGTTGTIGSIGGLRLRVVEATTPRRGKISASESEA